MSLVHIVRVLCRSLGSCGSICDWNRLWGKEEGEEGVAMVVLQCKQSQPTSTYCDHCTWQRDLLTLVSCSVTASLVRLCETILTPSGTKMSRCTSAWALDPTSHYGMGAEEKPCDNEKLGVATRLTVPWPCSNLSKVATSEGQQDSIVDTLHTGALLQYTCSAWPK